MDATILSWVTHYGYAGIFALLMLGILGLPVPDETLLALSGYLVHQGELQFLPTVAAAFAGSVFGITLSYLAGRHIGNAVVRRYGRWFHLREAHLDAALAWFTHLGKYSLTAGYFIPGVRHVIAVAAGSSNLPWRTFAAFAYTGGLVWTAGFVSLGYYVGAEWRSILLSVHHRVVASSLILAGLTVAYFLWRKR